MANKMRQLFYYQWENGASLNVSLFGDIDTLQALARLDELIALKRAEIAQNAANQSSEGSNG